MATPIGPKFDPSAELTLALTFVSIYVFNIISLQQSQDIQNT